MRSPLAKRAAGVRQGVKAKVATSEGAGVKASALKLPGNIGMKFALAMGFGFAQGAGLRLGQRFGPGWCRVTPTAFRCGLLASVLLGACSLDLQSLRAEPGSESSTDSGTVISAPIDAGTHAPSDTGIVVLPEDAGFVDPGLSEDAGHDAGAPTVDAGPPDAGLRPSCGVAAAPCCQPSNSCEQGVCLRGTCQPYGGVHMDLECSLGCAVRNAYTAGCSCAPGFASVELGVLSGQCGAEASMGPLRICGAGAVGEDYAGVYLRGTACGCLRGNALTGDCGCPAGSRPVEVEVAHEACPEARLGLCVGDLPGSFGGIYQGSGAGGCHVPNPFTGGCLCPDGFVANPVPLQRSLPGGGALLDAPVTFCGRP